MANVLLFGHFAEIAGWRARTFDAASLSELRASIETSDPALAEALARRGTIAVNQEIVAGDQIIGPDDEVALFPPVSGG